MRAFAGLAASHAGAVLHRFLHILLAVVILLAAAVGALAWRLSQGPLNMPWLAHRLEDAANTDSGGVRVTIGSAALAWEGFRNGVDRPLDVRATDIGVLDKAGRRLLDIPRAEVSLSVGRLLFGRIVPRAIAVDGARVNLTRTADGALAFDLGAFGGDAGEEPVASPGALMAEFARPPQTDLQPFRSVWAQLRRVELRNAALRVTDRKLGRDWQVQAVSVDLQRAVQGGVTGRAEIALALADQHARLDLQARLPPGGASINVAAQLSPLVPAALAAAVPALTALAAVDAPVTLSGSATLDTALVPGDLHLRAGIGAGRVALGRGTLPILNASLQADGTPAAFDVKLGLEVTERPDGPHSHFTGDINARREGGALLASGVFDFDQVDFAGLPALWPEGVGGKGARPWVTANITAGTAQDGNIALGLRIPDDFASVHLTSLGGSMTGHDITVHWLRPVPPLEHGEATLNFIDPDTLAIAVRSARQAGLRGGGVAVTGGLVRVTGLSVKDQFLDIDGDLAGSLPDLLTALRNPEIHLLDRRPIEMRDPQGQFAGHLSIPHMPLEDSLTMDDVQIRTTAHLTGVHLGRIAAGRDLDNGVLDLQASNDGLKLDGTAAIAGLPATLGVEMNFRDGPPSEVLQKVTISGNADARQLSQADIIDLGGMVRGAAAVRATWQSRRDNSGDITVHADLAPVTVGIPKLNWSKPAGRAATADVHVKLSNDRLTGIDRLAVQGDGIDAQGAVDFAGGHPVVARLQHLALGGDIDLRGEIRWPGDPRAPWVIDVTGRSLDVTAELSRSGPTPPPDDRPGPAWRATAHFDRVLLSAGHSVTNVSLRAENDGVITRSARLTGESANRAPFSFTIAPEGTGRRLTGTTGNAGGLLSALDINDNVLGGQMTLNGVFDDRTPAHALSGTAEMRDFRVAKAPVLARLLQAMTLYGLVGMIQGPGLGFDRLEAPFRIDNDILELNDARVFSSSLGMTVKGRVGLGHGGCDLQGTIVPAYFFNSLLGGIPLLGKLFSPERGGGLFAATYTVSGKCDDPSVSVNPLAALTPGFLRGVFGIFGGGAAAPGK